MVLEAKYVGNGFAPHAALHLAMKREFSVAWITVPTVQLPPNMTMIIVSL
jgi:hypothetical protein